MSDKNLTSLQPMPTLHISPYRQNIIAPGTPMDEIYIPSPDLELAVQAFLFMHQFPKESPRTPRSMLLQGAPGTGKTLIAMHSALRMGCAIMVIAPSIFASKHEGGGVEKIIEAMQEAERYSHAHRTHIAVLFDDIDHSNLSIDDNTGKTTNPATIIGHLQSLSTNRNVHAGFNGLPIPIIATANSANRIAPSLFRNMRAKVYTHTMDDATKQQIARALFEPADHAESTMLTKLYRTHRKEDVAFWPALASDYRSKRIEGVIRANGFDRAKMEHALTTRLPLDGELLAQLAETCRKTRPFDFLAKLRSAT